MRLGALFGWGIVIYAVTMLASTGMELYGFMQGILPHIVEFCVLAIVCIIAGSSLKFRKWIDILPYSIGWAILFAILLGVYFVPQIGWGLYSAWSVWLDCLLVVLLPLCARFFAKRKIFRGVWET